MRLRALVAFAMLAASAHAQTQLWKYDHADSDYFGGLTVFSDVDGDGVVDFATGDSDDNKIFVVSGGTGAELRKISDPSGCGFGDFPSLFQARSGTSTTHPDLIVTDPSYSTACSGYDAFGALYRFDLATGALLESKFGIKFHEPWFTSMGLESGVGPTNGKVEYWYSGEKLILFMGYKKAVLSGTTSSYILADPILHVHGVGDVDGDGSDDFAILSDQLYIYSGKDTTKLRTVDYSTFVLFDAVGDVDGDGLGDFAVTDYAASGAAGSGVGKVYVHSGAVGTPLLRTIEGSQPNSNLGTCFGGVGDVDGDGRADFAVAEPGYHDAQFPDGVVHVYSGKTGFELARIGGSGHVGGGISGGFDLNGDGVPDLVTAAYGVGANVTAWALDRKPVVVSVTPNRARYDATPTIDVRGANFRGSVTVDVGGVAATNVTIVSDSELTARVPSLVTGPATVTVHNSLGAGSLADAYWATPAAFFTGTPSVGTDVTLHFWVDSSDETWAFFGLAPPVPTPTPPYHFDFCISPATFLFSTPSAGTTDLALDESIPNDPTLVGETFLFQAIAGPRVTSKPKDGAWSNCAELVVE
jgi:hypothetical protein